MAVAVAEGTEGAGREAAARAAVAAVGAAVRADAVGAAGVRAAAVKAVATAAGEDEGAAVAARPQVTPGLEHGREWADRSLALCRLGSVAIQVSSLSRYRRVCGIGLPRVNRCLRALSVARFHRSF